MPRNKACDGAIKHGEVSSCALVKCYHTFGGLNG